jgi:hypothetical protein
MKTKAFQTHHLILTIGILLVALSLSLVNRFSLRDNDNVIVQPILTESTCNVAGGTWNSCGSACRGQIGETACIQVCVEMCECGVDSDCPFGYSCKDMIEGIGICSASS